MILGDGEGLVRRMVLYGLYRRDLCCIFVLRLKSFLHAGGRDAESP